MSDPIVFDIPVRTKTINQILRSHWRAWARIAAEQRSDAYVATWNALRSVGFDGAWDILMTRIAPRPLDDDNLQGALKSVRDGIADCLGKNDRDPFLMWSYDQRKGKPKEYSVEVVMRRMV